MAREKVESALPSPTGQPLDSGPPIRPAHGKTSELLLRKPRKIRLWLKRSAIHALYFSGLLWLCVALKLRGRGVALMYHRVLPPKARLSSRSSGAIQVTTETFEKHVRLLKRLFKPISASRLADYLANGHSLPSRTVLITFDDGWYDNAAHAAPILNRHGVPAIVFVANDFVGKEGGFWQEQLAWLLDAAYREGLPETGMLREFGFNLTADLPEDQVQTSIRAIVDEVKLKEGANAPKLVERVRQSMSRVLPAARIGCFGDDYFMDWQDLTDLGRTGLVELGSHACSHTPLTMLSDPAVAEELRQSRSALETRLCQPVRCFAYPNGDYDRRVVEQVRTAGYDLAFTTRYGLLSSKENLHALGRVSVHEDAADSFPMLLARIAGII